MVCAFCAAQARWLTSLVACAYVCYGIVHFSGDTYVFYVIFERHWIFHKKRWKKRNFCDESRSPPYYLFK